MSKQERIVKPFTNKFGQVIKPGDQVISITTCTGTTCVNKAEYIGYIEHKQIVDYRTREYKMMPFVQVRRPYKVARWVHKGTDEPYDFRKYYTMPQSERPEHEIKYDEVYKISTLNYNNIIPFGVSTEQFIEAFK